ncbi:S41 family peptidase [Undibacterium pigrum]|uniref:Peptidase S41-like protein n=1 Tax=Undibacterium pigrum TaxID=401470 RepID=A0A318J7N7_9BURK|nr:S41 family peptidase [Undibacterium pigrum]PXX43143.1 peptidase S41-like protein [Undibacterium pigrum]
MKTPNFLVLAGFFLLPALSNATSNNTPKSTAISWSQAALADLQGVRDTLEANHPGPVDVQNPGFKLWLKQGFEKARTRARNAQSFEDYRRVLQFYTNGFRDGHISVSYDLESTSLRWPQFLVGGNPARVTVADDSQRALKDAQLLDCDGKNVDQLLQEFVDPYYWNRDIPHQRHMHLPQLMLWAGRAQAPITSCRFESADKSVRNVSLKWTNLDTSRRGELLKQAAGDVLPEMGIRRVQDTWFVSIPSFDDSGAAALARLQSMVAALKAHREELHKAPLVVIDVRGNHGGNSSWAEQMLAILFSQEAVDHIGSYFDETTDWRVSAGNLQALQKEAARMRAAGLTEAAQYRQAVADDMKTALHNKQLLLHTAFPPTPANGTLAASPFLGKVYFLTDQHCFSACLDFADLARRLPGVKHIGLPTAADAVYIDNTGSMLPTGIARLSYSLKVYRKRVRGNNEWYDPSLRWPGGVMSDDAIVNWIHGM